MNKPVSLARALRQQETDAERKLWFLLRGRRFIGYKFRRQFPVGPYIADFCCYSRRLIVELDGGQHDALADRDQQRSLDLRRLGFRVIRFWNIEALTQTQSVLERILAEMERPTPLSPSPAPSGHPLPEGEGRARGGKG